MSGHRAVDSLSESTLTPGHTNELISSSLDTRVQRLLFIDERESWFSFSSGYVMQHAATSFEQLHEKMFWQKESGGMSRGHFTSLDRS